MLLRLLRTQLRPYAGLVAMVLILQLVATVASLWLPTLNADIIDNGIARGDTAYIWRVGGLMLAASAVQVAAQIAGVWGAARVAMGVGRDLRAGVFDRVLTFSSRELGSFGAPTLITRSTNDVQQVQMLTFMSLIMLASAPITGVGGVIMAMRQDVGLSWLIAVAVVVLLAGVGLVIRAMVPLFRAQQLRLDNVNRVLREQISGIRVVRAFTREEAERERFGRTNTELTEVGLRVGDLIAVMFPFVMLVMNLSSVGVLWFGAQRIDAGAMEVGSLTAYISYLIQILMSIMMATMVATMIPRAAVSAERIGAVLDTRTSVVAPERPVAVGETRGLVQVEGAGFTYPGAETPVLHDITFTARPGTTTAIVGGTGSGKTTLLRLLPRLADVTAGRVRVDDVDVRDLAPADLWSRVGLVPQRPYLFSGTVASNLRFGRPDATDEELWEALRVAQAEDFVRGFPEGLDHPVSQGGTNVSGGQRQRLCIARALVGRPEIYLFDDSFSALDLATDARLRAALRPLTREATVITVAQRISTIVDADQIVVLDAGRVVGIGTHDELVATNPTYGEIVRSQEQGAAV
ncbi:ABC transporter ATP-binding protein [Ornithinimicrobium humiphilum]|uniref:ATP-binding cassette subfamily B protein n=1 Tax=Ornithinimicrobium humiphilum TaxID=125288 RepID=A0A543KJJ1_9MICO|nr:ABC transporter ATP-binding protein [Ornithinimicrobium humiphilum]TQM95251.1 ATP-binding cassette subfamily B protein [Ornithinimicrobium humiphilum]